MVMEARDPEVTRKVVAEHRSTMEARLSEIEHIVGELQKAEDQPTLHTPVHVREEPEVHALMFSGVVQHADYAPFLDRAFAAVWAAINQTGAVPAGPGSALYPPNVDYDDEPVQAYVPIQHPVAVAEKLVESGVVLAIVPAATCAVSTHIGSYVDISETYRQLGAWVAHNATFAEQAVREHYVVSVDPATGLLYPDDQLRTEISWPVVVADHMKHQSTEESS